MPVPCHIGRILPREERLPQLAGKRGASIETSNFFAKLQLQRRHPRRPAIEIAVAHLIGEHLRSRIEPQNRPRARSHAIGDADGKEPAPVRLASPGAILGLQETEYRHYGEEQLPLAQRQLAGLPGRGSILLTPVGSRLQVGDALPAKSCFACQPPGLRRPSVVSIERQDKLARLRRP